MSKIEHFPDWHAAVSKTSEERVATAAQSLREKMPHESLPGRRTQARRACNSCPPRLLLTATGLSLPGALIVPDQQRCSPVTSYRR